jgi:hypothetical protein
MQKSFGVFRVMAAACIAASVAFGQTAFPSPNQTVMWQLIGSGTTQTLTISGTGAMPNFTSSGMNNPPWYYGRAGITTAVIESGVTYIGDYVFQYCTGLTSVNIPNSVTYIGQYAFNGCTGLTEITIPNSVRYMSTGVFTGCPGLTAINFDGSNANYASVDGVLFNNSKTLLRIYPAGKAGAYTVPNSVTSISDYAFEYCKGLTEITITNSVTSIGYNAFNGCTGLTAITIPESVTSIEGGAFQYCTGLTAVTIPNSVTSIGNYAFNGCTGLKHIVNKTAAPLTINANVFTNVTAANVDLLVPASAVEAYKAADVWKDFGNIAAFNIAKPEFTPAALAYTGVEQTAVIAEGLQYTISGNKGTNAGSYTAKVVLVEGCEWLDGTTDELTFEWTIAKDKLAKPTAAANLAYNSDEQSAGIAENANYTITGDVKGTNANTYTATVALKDKTNYEWADGTDADLTLTWTIAKANPQHTAPTGLTAKVGQTLAEVSLTAHAGWEWMDATELVGEVGERTHKAKFTPEDVANYNVLTDIDVKIVVSAATPINNIQKSDGRTGIRLSKNIVSDKAEFEVVLPNDKVLEVKVAIYDNTGNVVFEKTQNSAKFVWNLTNAAGRNVANGTYLIIAEARGAKGTYAYSAKVGVKR